jgi:AraC-like DNA-binding protein
MQKEFEQKCGEHLNNRGLIEAKRYLLHTDNTINEIAEILLFSDASNFVKYFKKNTGFTPAQFRKHYFQ